MKVTMIGLGKLGLPVAEVKDILTDLNEINIISTIRNKYQLKK